MTMSYNILFWHISGYFQFHPATWKHWFHLYILIMPHRGCWRNSATNPGDLQITGRVNVANQFLSLLQRCSECFLFYITWQFARTGHHTETGSEMRWCFPDDQWHMYVTYRLACLYLDVCVVPHVAYCIIYLGVDLNVLDIRPDFELFKFNLCFP